MSLQRQEREQETTVPAGFPGVAETEVYIPSLDRTVKVRPGQVRENVPSLSRAEFQKASDIQKRKDAEYEAARLRGEDPENPNRKQPAVRPSSSPPASSASVATTKSAPSVPPDGNGRVAKKQVVGKYAPKKTPGRPSQTALTNYGEQIQTLEGRITGLETGITAILTALQGPPPPTQVTAAAPPAHKLRLAMSLEDEFDDDFAEPNEEPEDPDFEDEVPEVEAVPPYLTEVVRMVQSKNPFRAFRKMVVRLLGNLCSIQNWPSEAQKNVERSFNDLLFNMGFLEGVYRQVQTFHNGQVVGPTIIFNYAVLLAGCSAILMQIPRRVN